MKSESKNSDSPKTAPTAAPQNAPSNNPRVKRHSEGSTQDGQNDGEHDEIVFEAKDNDWYEEHKKKENMFKLFRQKVETGAKEAEIASASLKAYPKPQFKYSKEELYALSQTPRSLIRPADLAPLYCKNEPGNLTEIKNEKIERSLERNAEKAAFDRNSNPDTKALTRSEDRTFTEKGRNTGDKIHSDRPNPDKEKEPRAKKGSWIKNDKVPPTAKKDKKEESTLTKEKKVEETDANSAANVVPPANASEAIPQKPSSARGDPTLAPENIVLGPPRKIFPSSQVSSKNPTRIGLSNSTASTSNTPLNRSSAQAPHSSRDYSTSRNSAGGSSRPNPRSNFYRSSSVANNISSSPSSSPTLQSANHGTDVMLGTNPKAPLYRSASHSNDMTMQDTKSLGSKSKLQSESKDGASKPEQSTDLVNSIFGGYKRVNLEEFLTTEPKQNDATSAFPAVRSKALSCWFDDQKASSQADPEEDSKLDDDEDLKDFEYLRRDYDMGDSNDDLVAFPGQSDDKPVSEANKDAFSQQRPVTANPKEWNSEAPGQFDFKNWLSSLSAPEVASSSQPKTAAPFSNWTQQISHYNADLMKNDVNIHGIPSVNTKHSLKTSESSPLVRNLLIPGDHHAMYHNDKGNRNGPSTNIYMGENVNSVTTSSPSSIAPSYSSPLVKGNYGPGNANGNANVDNVNKYVNKSGGHSVNFGMNIPSSSFDKSTNNNNNQQPHTVLNLLASLQTSSADAEQDKAKSQRKESREKAKQGPEKPREEVDVNKAFNSKNPQGNFPQHPVAPFFNHMGNYPNPYGNPQFNEVPFGGHSFGMHGQDGHNAQQMGPPHPNFHAGGYPPFYNMHSNFMNMGGMQYDPKGGNHLHQQHQHQHQHQQPLNMPGQASMGNNNHGGPVPHPLGQMHFGQPGGAGLEKWFGNISHQTPHHHQMINPNPAPLPRNAKIMFLDEIENKMK